MVSVPPDRIRQPMKSPEPINQISVLAVAAVLAVAFWVFDSLLDGLLFEQTGWVGEWWPEDGKELWMRLLVVGLLLLLGVYGQRALNERRRANEQLRLSETVFRSAGDGILVTDADNRIITVNPAFERITGFARDEVLGKDPRILQSGRQGPAFYDELWRELKRTGRWQGEIWDRRKSGDVYPKWLSISAVQDDSGRVASYVAIFRDISSVKEAEQRLEYLAHFDPLTGLANRRLLVDRLNQALALARRRDWWVTVIFLDLDHFKEVNDSLGHVMGDQLLVAVARRLADVLRESDTIARQGGDEFVILLEGAAGAEAVTEILEKLRLALAAPCRIDDHELLITASMGVSLFPDDGQDADTLLMQADAAMYHTKREGRDGWSFYASEMNSQSHRRLRLASELRRAIDEEQLVLHYQPQLELTGGRLTGVEALVRWQHPEWGLLAPAEFIPLAEDTGLIDALGDWVLRAACRQWLQWQADGAAPPRVAVNVSARQFRRADFVPHLEQTLAGSDMEPRCLELEFTESLLIRTEPRFIAGLERLRALGVQFTLDDFGTGYSSLTYLQRFPISRIKVDGSFVRHIPADRDDMAITAAILSLARELDLRVVAEGVESAEQLEFLRRHGCHEIQGDYVARPMPAAEFVGFARRYRARRQEASGS